MGSSTELHQISMINEENDLGITFSHDFKFRSHIHKIVQKANKILGIIKHTFKYLEPDIMRLLYTSLVRPHLDYASNIWNPICWKTHALLRRYKGGLPNSFHHLNNIPTMKD